MAGSHDFGHLSPSVSITPGTSSTGSTPLTRYGLDVFSRLRTAPAVPLDLQSVVPSVRGLPWWGACLLACGFAAVGAIIDVTGATSELGAVFKAFVFVGCVLAAILARRRALFTAAAQPPLIFFIVGALSLYAANTGADPGFRDIVLRVLLPIATAFPWMLITFLATLALVVARWYYTRPDEDVATARSATAPQPAKAPAQPAEAGSAAAARSGKPRPAQSTGRRRAQPAKARPDEGKSPARRTPAHSDRARRSRAEAPTAKRAAEPAPTKRPAAKRAAEPAPAKRPARQTAGQMLRASAGEQIIAAEDVADIPDSRG